MDADVINETVDLIGYFTRRHNQILSELCAGEFDCNDLLDQLQLGGAPLSPLLARLGSPETPQSTPNN